MRLARLALAGHVLCVLVLSVDYASAATTTALTTTPVPDTTPAPAAGTPVRVSFLIDGVVYVMQCNFTGLNMSNCSFAMDHGLTVTPLSASGGSTDLPLYIVVMLGFTLALVVVLVGLAAYLVWSRNTGQTSGGYAAPPEQGPPYQPDSQYGQYQGPGYYGSASSASGRPKIISVNLVQPCLPPDTTSLP